MLQRTELTLREGRHDRLLCGPQPWPSAAPSSGVVPDPVLPLLSVLSVFRSVLISTRG